MYDFLQPHGLEPIRPLCLWNFPGKYTGVGCHFHLRGIILTQGLNMCLLHCWSFLYYWATWEALVINKRGKKKDIVLFENPDDAGDLYWAVLWTEYLHLRKLHSEALITTWRVGCLLEVRPLGDNWVWMRSWKGKLPCPWWDPVPL